MVVSGFYRSGHPIELNYPFLETLSLKTIVYLGDRTDEENEKHYQWADEHGIRHISFTMKSVKEPFVLNNEQVIESCLKLLFDKEIYPVLVHSNKGKHRVGVLVGVFRRLILGWSLAATYEEYTRFARSKAEPDVAFIEAYRPDLEIDLDKVPAWLRIFLLEQRKLAIAR